MFRPIHRAGRGQDLLKCFFGIYKDTGCNPPIDTFCLDYIVFIFKIELVKNVKILGDFTQNPREAPIHLVDLEATGDPQK